MPFPLVPRLVDVLGHSPFRVRLAGPPLTGLALFVQSMRLGELGLNDNNFMQNFVDLGWSSFSLCGLEFADANGETGAVRSLRVTPRGFMCMFSQVDSARSWYQGGVRDLERCWALGEDACAPKSL